MSRPEERLPSIRYYFVDEAGDGTLFSKRGRVIVGMEGCSHFFILGLLDVPDTESLAREMEELRAGLLADPYFRGVPSMQPEAKKTALAFHAKDDLPEVRREVFNLLLRHNLRFFAVVRDKRNALQRALEAARHRFCAQWRIVSDAPIHAVASTPPECAGLQAVDYFLWALQRLYERREDRYVELLWPAFGLVNDLDDTRRARYGVYYSQKKPLALAALEDLPGI